MPACGLLWGSGAFPNAVPALPGIRDTSGLCMPGDAPPDMPCAALYRSFAGPDCDIFVLVSVCADIFTPPCRISALLRVFVPAEPIPAAPGGRIPAVLYTPGGMALYLDLRGAASVFSVPPTIPVADFADRCATEPAVPALPARVSF
jgi:hypothetical protein